jgi:phage gp46-like protein
MIDYGLFIGEKIIDMVLVPGDIAGDDGLETAVIISLFSDARATDDMLDAIDNDGDLRGFWGDITRPDDSTGSLLWTMKRSKQLTSTLAKARGYCQDALSWLVQDQIAQRVEVRTRYLAPASGVMIIEVDIYRPGSANPVLYRYGYEWSAQLLKVNI